MGGEGQRPNASAQEGCILSLILKDGVRRRAGGGRDQGGDHDQETSAWSEPRELGNKMHRVDREDRARATSLAKTKSRTEGHWSSWPCQVGTRGVDRSCSPEVSNQSSRVAAQEEVVA
jgi:hypothetical protein